MKKLPLFNWLTDRGAGVLLHPTCFPGDQGIGTLDYSARSFIDFLEKCNFGYWQVCPLGPTGFGDSPYQTFSVFAGNPYLIDLRQLTALGLLHEQDLEPFRFLPGSKTDFGMLYEQKWPVLYKSFLSFKKTPERWEDLERSFRQFVKVNEKWLEPYGLFMALKQKFEGRSWLDWPDQFRNYSKLSTHDLDTETLLLCQAHKFYQFLFFQQWNALKAYADKKGIRVIGDIPIFAALDSVDAWSCPEFFQIDLKRFRPKAFAGVPPDYFAEDGQFWGNPLYNWSQLEKNGYRWWLDRLAMAFNLYDIVRIDHFRGFEAYWSIAAGAEKASQGMWMKGPGLPFFEAVKDSFPAAKIIAEDLGLITPEVTKLREDTGLPAIAVLQFAFGGRNDNFYLPHNLKPNSVVYSGTHDNDTSVGWYNTASESTKDHLRRYLEIPGDAISWDLIRAAYRSVSKLAVFPLQDLMSLGSEARMNMPGHALGNWQWRYQTWQLEKLTRESSIYLKKLAHLYRRIPAKEKV